MDGSIRVSAKTVDDAITEALIQLGVTSDRLEYEVIEKGSAGFLGIGMKQAVIDAKRKPESAEKPKSTKKSDTAEEPKSTEKSDTAEKLKPAEKSDPAEEPKAHVKDEKPQVKSEPARTFDKKDIKEEEEVKQEAELAQVKDETKAAVEAFLNDTLKAMGMNVELVSGIDKSGALCIEMKGEGMGILIGKRGQTLDALQYLANRVANKHQEGYVRIKLDTENYRARREETLKNLAKNIAFKVKRSRKPVSLEPMNPYERRIIHAALQADPYVTTHSEGDEPYRKVVVTLKK